MSESDDSGVDNQQTPEFIESMFLLLGSYIIALLLTTAIHEIGHSLALASIPIDFRLILNPFSTSMTMPLDPIPPTSLFFAVAAGTVVELIFGTIVFVIFWKWRNPKFLPILMAAPISYLSSAGYYLVGTAVSDGDTALMISMGVPAILIQSLGVLMLILGVVLLILMFPLLGISQSDSFLRIFSILFLGMVLHGFGMIAFALLFNPADVYIGIANVISMTITVTVLAGVFVRGNHIFNRLSHTEVAQLDRTTVLAIAVLALVLIILELLFLN
ncbi:MAG: hypothetical protein RTV72_00565 [Candidatus Thorarchaeota archaeon]